MTHVIKRWHGSTWTAIVTHEPYGLHFSVGGVDRPPTDDEVDAARDAYDGILPSAEFTGWWARNGQVNPWVRHFAHPEHVARLHSR